MKNGYIFPLDSNNGGNPGATVKKKFEIIEEIVIAEGEETKLIKRSTEPDGTPYSFDEVLIDFDMEPVDKTYSLTCNVNGVSSVGMSDILGTERKYATLRYDVSKGILDTTYQVSTTNPTWASAQRVGNADTLFVESINSITFQAGTVIPVGSKITILAIRH